MQEGDIISFDIPQRRLDVALTEAQMAERMHGWSPPAPRYTSGVFAKYAALLSSASEGAVTQV